jgi:hypothetical protein
MLYDKNPRVPAACGWPLQSPAEAFARGFLPSNMPPSTATPTPVQGRAAAAVRSPFGEPPRPLDAGLRGERAFASAGGSSREGGR